MFSLNDLCCGCPGCDVCPPDGNWGWPYAKPVVAHVTIPNFGHYGCPPCKYYALQPPCDPNDPNYGQFGWNCDCCDWGEPVFSGDEITGSYVLEPSGFFEDEITFCCFWDYFFPDPGFITINSLYDAVGGCPGKTYTCENGCVEAPPIPVDPLHLIGWRLMICKQFYHVDPNPPETRYFGCFFPHWLENPFSDLCDTVLLGTAIPRFWGEGVCQNNQPGTNPWELCGPDPQSKLLLGGGSTYSLMPNCACVTPPCWCVGAVIDENGNNVGNPCLMEAADGRYNVQCLHVILGGHVRFSPQ
jgi:hypothetical protein